MPLRLRHPEADTENGPDAVDVNGTVVRLGPDGEFEAPESWAKRWCRANGWALDKVRVDDGDTDDEVMTFDPTEFTVDELREFVADISSVEGLKAARDYEAGSKDRATALEAIDARIAELED